MSNDADRLRAALFAGRKIEAIKIYRQRTGAGLKDAKDAVDTLEAELRQTEPESFTAPPARGCGLGVLLLLIAGGLGYTWR